MMNAGLAAALLLASSTAESVDPQIKNLLQRFSTQVADPDHRGAAPAHLIKSYADRDDYYLYDQALAVIALSHAGQRAAAETILNAAANLQLPSGAWYFSYRADGACSDDLGAERQPSGAIAWMVIAMNVYQKQFASDRYVPAAARALAHLDTRRADVDFGGARSRPVRFDARDLPATRWSELQVISVEHNLDAYAAFDGFARQSGDARFAQTAREIRTFVESMWTGRAFYAGFDLGTGRPNEDETYLDTQSWGVLALGAFGLDGQEFFRGLTETNCTSFLARGGRGFFDVKNGQTAPNPEMVWTEGSLGVALALEVAEQATQRPVSCAGLESESFVGFVGALVDAHGGVPYATQPARGEFSTSSSVAGTAWFYFAKRSINPFAPSA